MNRTHQLQAQEQSLSTTSLLGGLTRRLREGNIGATPVLLGLVLIAVIFQLANPNFLTPLNLTNLMMQISAMGTISVGLVLVLLLGDIDLSAGAVSGLGAGVMAVLSVKSGLPAPLAVALGIASGSLIGLLQGAWIAKFRVPALIVTLAGLLGWQGALLFVLGSTGSVNLTHPLITGLANTRLPIWLGIVVGVALLAGLAYSAIREQRQRRLAEMQTQALPILVGRITVIATAILAAVYIMSVDRSPTGADIRGIPSAVLIFLSFTVVFDFITRRTRFGRSIYAVGGNREAARRAGIDVDRIRISAFVLCSTLAACGGILAASRLYAVNQASGGGDILLNSIAAAVIGGTSLFGGRGHIWSAVLGSLVIGSIANGMDLLALSSSIKFMVTGAVLLAAVTIDAYARTLRERAGR